MSNRPAEFWREQRPYPLIPNWVRGLILLVLLVGIGAAIFVAVSAPDRAASLAGLTAVESRLTLDLDNGRRLMSVDRHSNSEVWYRVTLTEAPIGSKLTVHCDWINPVGQVVHQNQYQTRVIDKKRWPTHARYRIGPESPVGTWTVRLSIEGRVLDTATLEVRDGEDAPPLEADGGKGGEL